MKSLNRFAMSLLAAAFLILLTTNPVWAQNYSPPRIVRMSFVEGDVTVFRPDVQAWSQAPANAPLQEGFKLSTGENSFAEVQFENGGTVRVGQLSLLDFTELGLAPNGGKINRLELSQGYATFHPLPSDTGDSLEVGIPCGKLTARGGTQFRVDLDQRAERVEVFQGTVEVQSNLGALVLETDSVLVLQPGTTEATIILQGITKDDWDQWVDIRESQMEMPPNGPAPESYASDAANDSYGWTDLLQYGAWSYVPGSGYGWTPTRVGGGWAPYSAGYWCWYAAWGYTWIGAEPWGWLPYHYGSWDFIPGIGWVWFPGSLRNWSPGQVTWFRGPGWIGWIPRPHREDGSIGCGNHCGGGVVSAAAFSEGGLLTSNRMLGFSPTSGERISEPGIVPTMATKLPGPAVSLPASQNAGSRGRPINIIAGAGAQGQATPALVPRGGRGAPPESTIAFDPQQNRYVNGNRVMPPQEPPAAPTGRNSFATPAVNPGLVQPGSVENLASEGRENQNLFQPAPMTGARPAAPGPRSEGYVAGPALPRGPDASGRRDTNDYVAAPNLGGSSGMPSASRPGGFPYGGGSPFPEGRGYVGSGGAPGGGHAGAAPASGGHR